MELLDFACIIINKINKVPIFGGFLVDRIGVRVSIVIFTGLSFLGQLICAFSKELGGGKLL
jgi:MFS family permease